MTPSKEFIISQFLSVRMERGQIKIYIAGKYFMQCKFLLLNIPITEIKEFDEIESIDEAAERMNGSG